MPKLFRMNRNGHGCTRTPGLSSKFCWLLKHKSKPTGNVSSSLPVSGKTARNVSSIV